jgi:serine protease Do
MRKLTLGLRTALFVLFSFAVVELSGARSAIAGAPMPTAAIADVVQRVSPSVVKIIVTRPPDKPHGAPVSAVGSGFVIDTAGLIATNRHVVENALTIMVGTADGGRYRAQIVGLAAKSDIALIRIEPDSHLPALAFGDSDALRPGETVIAIGSPFGFDSSVTAGIVSSINRDIMESPFDDYIQTDAAINHGNSGGPLFNLAGQVVGMNSVLFAPGKGSAGVGFAIPSNQLRFALGRLAQYGDVRAGMLPIRTQPVTGLMAAAMGVPTAGGALIASLGPQAPMMNRQIQPGDIITQLDGQPISDPRELARKAAEAQPGSNVTLQLYRLGKLTTVQVPILPLDAAPSSPGAAGHPPKTTGLRFAQHPGGVLLTALDPAGSAADSGLKQGDVILRIQGEPVATPDQVSNLLRAKIEAKQAYTAFLIERDNEQTWLPVALPD